MGLREINAERTRTLVAEAAMELFLDRGFDTTTLEEVAAHAGIGNSTLYRYFPTKEDLVLGSIGEAGALAADVRQRPADEPGELALGHALIALLERTTLDLETSRQFRGLIASSPRLNARLLDWLGETRRQLEEALAERTDAPRDSTAIAATAWLGVFVLERASEVWNASAGEQTIAVTAHQIMREMQDAPIRAPRLPA